MKEIYLFVKRFFTSPAAIGSLLPSSKQLGLCMAQQSINHTNQPLRYLEVGAGSGALTRPIIQCMKKNDWMDIVEKDPKFCSSLRKQFSHLSNVAIHEISILDFTQKNYDVVLSSLPLNAFKADMVHEILKKYESLVKQGGRLSYYEYLGLEKIKQAFLFGKQAVDFKDVQVLKQSFARKYQIQADTVWWNVPPARVVHCKLL